MEISETRRRGKYRKRGTPRDENATAQTSAFPTEDVPRAAENLEQDAAEKEKVKKAVAAIPVIFTPENVEWLFDAYVAVLSFAYSLILKVEFSEVQKELEFDKEQKEQLAKPLAKICSKYAPAEWAGMTDEIQLITLMGVWTVASFQRARNVQRRIEEKKKDELRTRPVDPIRRQQPVSEIHVPA